MKSDKVLKTEFPNTQFELLVPANNKTTAIAAIKAGADAVYIGYSKFGARAQAGNSIEDLIEVVNYAHIYRVKVYVTLNTILKDEELDNVQSLIWKLYAIKTDGIIIQDMGILELDLPPIPIIASTQCHNNTLEKIKFLQDTGFKRVILPREITLDEIKDISENTTIELECFIHGALCMSYSGQCYMSCKIGGRSANRGECAQPCRKKYSLKDANGNFIIKDKYLLSLKDFNLSDRIEELIINGITSFKIEGRLKNENYVTNTTAFYRKTIDKVLQKYNLKHSSQGYSEYNFEPNLYKTFNRGYTEFNITGKKNNLATIDYTASLGEYIGQVKSIDKNSFYIPNANFNNGDGICFFDEAGELKGTNINKFENDKIFPASMEGIKKGIKIYRNYDKKFDDTLKSLNITRKIPVSIKIRNTNTGLIFFISDEENNTASHMIQVLEEAQNKEKALKTLEQQLSKTGNTEFSIANIDIKSNIIPYLKVSKINEIRRILTDKLSIIRQKTYPYKKRENKINIIEYPIKTLDYKANVFNKKAEDFYIKRGCKIEEYAFEKNSSANKNAILMTSKYCIKNQLGLCPKQTKQNQYKEPFILIDECGKEYLTAYSCSDCVMSIIAN